MPRGEELAAIGKALRYYDGGDKLLLSTLKNLFASDPSYGLVGRKGLNLPLSLSLFAERSKCLKPQGNNKYDVLPLQENTCNECKVADYCYRRINIIG